jgi:hypothetical protein
MTTEIAVAPLNLTVSRALTRAEAGLAREVAEAVYRSAFLAGFEAGVQRGYDAGVRGSLASASALLVEATRELAAAGPAYAALMLPVTKRVDRDLAGRIVSITESRT